MRFEIAKNKRGKKTLTNRSHGVPEFVWRWADSWTRILVFDPQGKCIIEFVAREELTPNQDIYEYVANEIMEQEHFEEGQFELVCKG